MNRVGDDGYGPRDDPQPARSSRAFWRWVVTGGEGEAPPASDRVSVLPGTLSLVGGWVCASSGPTHAGFYGEELPEGVDDDLGSCEFSIAPRPTVGQAAWGAMVGDRELRGLDARARPPVWHWPEETERRRSPPEFRTLVNPYAFRNTDFQRLRYRCRFVGWDEFDTECRVAVFKALWDRGIPAFVWKVELNAVYVGFFESWQRTYAPHNGGRIRALSEAEWQVVTSAFEEVAAGRDAGVEVSSDPLGWVMFTGPGVSRVPRAETTPPTPYCGLTFEPEPVGPQALAAAEARIAEDRAEVVAKVAAAFAWPADWLERRRAADAESDRRADVRARELGWPANWRTGVCAGEPGAEPWPGEPPPEPVEVQPTRHIAPDLPTTEAGRRSRSASIRAANAARARLGLPLFEEDEPCS